MSETYDPLQDALRCWYDERDFGLLCDRYPLYAALGKSCLHPDDASRTILDEYTVQLVQEMSHAPVANGWTQHRSDASLFAAADKIDSLFSAEPVNSNSFADVPEAMSITETIALANELKLNNEAISKRLTDGQRQRMKLVQEKLQQQEEQIATLKRQAEAYRQQTIALQSQRAVDHSEAADSSAKTNESTEVSEPNRFGKFKSALQQFTKDGGKLASNQKAAAAAAAGGGGGVVGSKRSANGNNSNSNSNSSDSDALPLPPELANFDRELVERIEADILHRGQPVTFDDISGLSFAKKCVTELICWPMTRPDLFQGLRALPKGVLLFGPPGTGKTLIGKAIAHQSGATFFSISASSLMSKWIGEGEKTVRTLFAVAAHRQPSVVFVDEVDSLLAQRSAEENEASRRMKTEFMVQLDGAGTDQSARVVIVGATNRPEELDEAVRRRFVKRIYIPLPDAASRRTLLSSLMQKVTHELQVEDIERLVGGTDGFSGADIRALCTEAAMGPVREVALRRSGDLRDIDAKDMPPVAVAHFTAALEAVTASVSATELHRYISWNEQYGSFRKASAATDEAHE